VQCPECKNTVPVTEAHYGALYTCPQCSAVYFVNFEGLPEYGDMQLESLSPSDSTDYSESSLGTEQLAAQSFESLQSVEQEINHFAESVDTFVDSVSLLSPDRVGIDAFSTAAQEITDYGNQEEVVSQISYDLLIRGLDSKELMAQFKDVIDDAKFGWIVQDLISEVVNGQLQLKNLNPVQAYVLAQRIYFLDLDLDWKQNVAF
jgi:hypothetical protein